MEPVQQTPNNSGIGATDNGRTVALVSYLTIIGWVVAYVMYSSQKTALGAFHLRQSIALFIIGFMLYVLNMIFFFVPFLWWVINIALAVAGVGLFVLWIIGLVAAVNGEQKPVPVIGQKAQEIFKGL